MKKQTSLLKNRQRTWRDIYQGRHIDGQQMHEKILTTTSHQGNAHQNYNVQSLTLVGVTIIQKTK